MKYYRCIHSHLWRLGLLLIAANAFGLGCVDEFERPCGALKIVCPDSLSRPFVLGIIIGEEALTCELEPRGNENSTECGTIGDFSVSVDFQNRLFLISTSAPHGPDHLVIEVESSTLSFRAELEPEYQVKYYSEGESCESLTVVIPDPSLP